MRKICLILICLLCLSSMAFGQVEQGDTEIQLMAYWASTSGLSIGIIHALIGYYITPNMQIGAGPAITIMTIWTYDFSAWEADTETEVEISSSFFGTYNFSTSEKLIPYITATWYQLTFDVPEWMDFTDFSYITVGGGVKYFLNEYVALNGSATYGFSLGGAPALFLFFGGMSVFL